MIGAVVVVIILCGVIFSRGKKPEIEANNSSASAVQDLYKKAKAFQDNNELVKAKDTYQQLMTNYPDYEDMENVQHNIEALNLNIIFSNVESPKNVVYEVQSGDTLGKLAKKYATTVELIKKKNNINSDVIRLGQKLHIWTGKFNILVDKSQNILILKDEDQVVKVYDVATGANNITPVGDFKIVNKLVDPVWFKAGAVIPPESPQNVLGTRWLGFDIPGYGIHGTVEPEKMRQQVTAGCVRMRNEEVEELYSLVPVGTPVKIVN